MKFPFKVPNGYKLKVTQPFGSISKLQFYKDRGIDIPFHNGVDIVLVDSQGREVPKVTYGSALITPSVGWQIVKTTFDNPMSTKGNGVTIQSSEIIDTLGRVTRWQLVFWHCSEVVYTKGILGAFETVGYVGNSGAVSPAPSIACPYCGSHLHLMLYIHEKRDGTWYVLDPANGVGGAQDVLKYIDINDVYYGNDTDFLKDEPPLMWLISQLNSLILSLKAQIARYF